MLRSFSGASIVAESDTARGEATVSAERVAEETVDFRLEPMQSEPDDLHVVGDEVDIDDLE
ncbi:MAG: hypothetical protein H0T79_09105 [Deltaproteobacteria bacterium]|nr:hypothetical protein [Deltaproteobacteria bacterium]